MDNNASFVRYELKKMHDNWGFGHKRTQDFGLGGGRPKGTRNLKLNVAKKLENLMEKCAHFSSRCKHIFERGHTKEKNK